MAYDAPYLLRSHTVTRMWPTIEPTHSRLQIISRIKDAISFVSIHLVIDKSNLLDAPTGIEWTVGHFPPGPSPIWSFRAPAVYPEKWGIHLNYRSLSRVPKYHDIICIRWIVEGVCCRVKFATWQQIQFFAIDFSSIHEFHTAVWVLFCECWASDKSG